MSRLASPSAGLRLLRILSLATLAAILFTGCGRSNSSTTAKQTVDAPFAAREIQPNSFDHILASRPGIFNPPPTAEQFAQSRIEGEKLQQRIIARIAEMKRLPPSAFPELPSALATELDRRRCTIPQTTQPQPNNVIPGEFARPGQQDWALLCSIRVPNATDTEHAYTTHLLVFWNGSPESPAQITAFPDSQYFEWSGDPSDPALPIFTGRGLSVASRDYILEHAQRVIEHASPSSPESKLVIPNPLDHQGINDGLWDKASEIHYFHQGHWLKLPGSD